MHTIIKVRWVIIKENSIFLVKDTTGWNFMLPWWKQEKWETIKETFYREMKEETWIDAIIEEFIWFSEYVNSKWQISMEFLFKVKNIEDFEKIDKSKCSHGFEWTEAWFYDIDFLKKSDFNIPKNLDKIIKKIKSKNDDYNYFL